MPAEPVKLILPPGFYQNGTEYSGAGRYIAGDLVRWHNGVIKPINGWKQRYDLAADDNMPPLWTGGAGEEAVRSGVVVGDETGGVDVYLGTNKALYAISNSNAITDVTPTEFTEVDKDATLGTGYGMYRYSFGQYGTPRPGDPASPVNAFSWGIDNWGFWPIAVARGIDGLPVFIKKDTDATFVAIPDSPSGAFDALVTDNRFLMTFGKQSDFRLVEWSDRENYEDWNTASISNQAGNFRLAGTGKLVRGIKVLSQILILGENDAFSGQFVGPPYVYGFNRVGSRCGLIGPNAVAATDTFAMWLSGLAFYQFDGTVKQVDCEVMDHYLKTANQAQRSKTVAFTLSDYSEIWWLYQSVNAQYNEPDSYIIYNHALQKWYTGTLERTFGMDKAPLREPLMVAPDGVVYDHEIFSAGRDGRVPYIATGPLETAAGGRLLGLSYVFPDANTFGDVVMELNVRDGESKPVRFSRQFTLQDPTSTFGIQGRDIRMKLSGALNNPNWVIGDFRVVPNVGSPGR